MFTLITGSALAAVAPPLGVAEGFAVLGASTVTNTGPTLVTGDLGLSPGTAVTGFPPGTLVGTLHIADGVALTAQSDATTAYNNLAGQAVDFDLTGQDLGGLTLTPGVYNFATSAQLTGTLTLDAQGDPNAVFIFKIGSTLTTASNATVLVINGGQGCNVFWQVGSSATLGTGTAFVGNIFALASITLNTGASVNGRALAQTGAVTMDSNAVTAAVCAVPPTSPTLGKVFNPASINTSGISTLNITLSNPNTTAATLTAPLTDTLPAGVVIAATPNASTTCGGGVTAIAGGSTVTLSGGSIAANGSCTLSVDVTAATAGSYPNTLHIGALQTSQGINVFPAIATLTVNPLTPAPPTLGKGFYPPSIDAGMNAMLSITLTNPNPSSAILTAPLIDTLPTGVVIAITPNATTTCGGSGAPVAVAGGAAVTLPAGRSIPANGSCTLTVNVTAAKGGAYINTLLIGALVTSNGSNTAPAIATLTVIPPVINPPTLGKAFNPASIDTGGLSTLTITLSNPNASVATLTAPLVDTLPSGVVIAATPNASTTCSGSGAPVAVAGGTTVTLPAGRSIPANGSCALTVNVTAANGGAYINSLLIGALVTSNGNNAAPAVATLTVIPPGPANPTLGKTFNPATINAGGIATLSVVLSNPNDSVATLTAPLVDTLPSGVVIAATPNASTTCGGSGAPVAMAGGTTVTLPAGRSIPANGSCTLTVSVTAAKGGAYLNTLIIGALVTSNGSNVAPAIATLTVIPPVINPPTLGKAFNPASINAGGLSTLTITLSNPNASVATLTAPLVDTLPSGVVIAATPNASTTCGGSGAPVAMAGGTTVTLPAGRSIPGLSSCTLTVSVTAANGGAYLNTLIIGALVTSNGSNAAPAVATLTVIPPVINTPTLGKAFNPSTIYVRTLSRLTITLNNPNATEAILTAPLVDTLPSGVVIAGTPDASTTCNGSVTAIPGGNTVTLADGAIPALGSCTLSVNVIADTQGAYTNTLIAGALVTSVGTNSNPASAVLTVLIRGGGSTPIPTLPEWGQILLSLLMMGLAWRRMAVTRR